MTLNRPDFSRPPDDDVAATADSDIRLDPDALDLAAGSVDDSTDDDDTDWGADGEDAFGQGDYELEERYALRRVAGLSTELEDITEVEYRQLRLERVVLVGRLDRGHGRGRRQLARRAQAAGRDGRL